MKKSDDINVRPQAHNNEDTERVGVTGGLWRGGVGWEREVKRDQQRLGISVAATVGDCLSARHTHRVKVSNLRERRVKAMVRS